MRSDGEAKNGYRKQSSYSTSKVGTSNSYSEMDQNGFDKEFNDPSFSNDAMKTEEGHSESPTNDTHTDISAYDPVDPENDHFTDAGKFENNRRNEDMTDQMSSTYTHAREARRSRNKNEQESPTGHFHADLQSGTARSEPPRKDRQTARDQKHVPSSNSGTSEAEDVDHRMARAFHSGRKSQPSAATSRSDRQSNKASAHQINGSESGSRANDPSQDYVSRNKLKDRPHTTNSKHASELIPSGRRETHKEISKPRAKSPGSVTVEELATICVQKMETSNNWRNDFWEFTDRMGAAIKESQDQINALSEEMLSGRDRYQPIPDGTFQSEMNSLRERIRGLSKDLLRPVKKLKMQRNEFRKTLEERILSSEIDDAAWSDDNRNHLIQSAIWRVLKDHLFASPFLVFGNEGPELGKAWRLLFTKAKMQDRIDASVPFVATELSEKWKSLSATRLEEKHHDDPGAGRERAAQEIIETLSNPLSANTLIHSADEGWGQKLNEVLSLAAQLAIGMAKQRSRLELYVPDVASLQQKRSSNGDVHALGKIIDVEDEHSISGDILFVVAPGLRRWGDGLGTNLNRHVDLEAAQVKCMGKESD